MTTREALKDLVEWIVPALSYGGWADIEAYAGYRKEDGRSIFGRIERA